MRARGSALKAPLGGLGLALAFVAGFGLVAETSARGQSACNPPCAEGQLCVKSTCMIPAPSSTGVPPGTLPEPPAGTPQPLTSSPPAGGYLVPQGPRYPPSASNSDPGWVYPPPPPPPAPPPPSAHTGFYLRLHLGGGYSKVSGEDSTGDRVTISGGAASFGVALGGAIAPNWIIFGNLFGTFISDPNVSLDGQDLGSGSGSADVLGFGGGVAYFLEPANVYLSASLAATKFRIDNSNGDKVYESDTGVGFQGIVGKEWRVSAGWGLGIAGELILASMKDSVDSSLTWTATAFSVLFSATYN